MSNRTWRDKDFRGPLYGGDGAAGQGPSEETAAKRGLGRPGDIFVKYEGRPQKEAGRVVRDYVDKVPELRDTISEVFVRRGETIDNAFHTGSRPGARHVDNSNHLVADMYDRNGRFYGTDHIDDRGEGTRTRGYASGNNTFSVSGRQLAPTANRNSVIAGRTPGFGNNGRQTGFPRTDFGVGARGRLPGGTGGNDSGQGRLPGRQPGFQASDWRANSKSMLPGAKWKRQENSGY